MVVAVVLVWGPLVGGNLGELVAWGNVGCCLVEKLLACCACWGKKADEIIYYYDARDNVRDFKPFLTN